MAPSSIDHEIRIPDRQCHPRNHDSLRECTYCGDYGPLRTCKRNTKPGTEPGSACRSRPRLFCRKRGFRRTVLLHRRSMAMERRPADWGRTCRAWSRTWWTRPRRSPKAVSAIFEEHGTLVQRTTPHRFDSVPAFFIRGLVRYLFQIWLDIIKPSSGLEDVFDQKDPEGVSLKDLEPTEQVDEGEVL